MHKTGDLEVMGEPGKGNWPLLGESRGTIIRCVWDGQPIVLFATPFGQQYVVNTDAGNRRGYRPLGWIMADAATRTAGAREERAIWIRADMALCEGDVCAAHELIDEANRLPDKAT